MPCGHALARHQDAPADDAGELRPVGAEYGKPDARLHAVRSDRDRRRGAVAVLERDRDRAAVLGDADAFAAEMDGVRPLAADGVEQHGVQVAAVEHHVGKAVAFHRDGAEVEQLPGLAGAPEPDLLAGDDDAEPLRLRAETERMEHAGAVGADLDAGAELFQLGRLLIDIDADALADQRQRRGQATDARSDDGDVVIHANLRA